MGRQAELDHVLEMNDQRYRFWEQRCHTQDSQLCTKYTENERCIPKV